MRGSAKAGMARLGLCLCAVAIFALPAAASAAAPAPLWKGCLTGHGAGQCSIPRGIGADPNLPGHLYVADPGNNRIVELTAWGEFVKAWGWGVKDGSPELQSCGPAAVPPTATCQAGLAGPGAGQLSFPQGVAVDSAGDVYVVDSNNHRVQKFDSAGDFLAAFGGDVVAHGPDDSSNDEQQQLDIAAGSGTFKLGFKNPLSGVGAAETVPLPFNAGAAEVKAALDALSTIGGLGGSVSVSGGPGDATGSAPYTIHFEGNLAGDDVPQLSIDRTGLGPASIGASLRCSSASEAETIEFAWLRNGTPIAGAESPTYTTAAADEGKAIQCQVRTENAEGGSALQAAKPVYVAPPEPAIAPPVVGTVSLVGEPNQDLFVGGPGGQTLTCQKSSPQGAESFSYRWYRNGTQIAATTASTYVVTSEDLASPALFQCAPIVVSNSGGTATVRFSVNNLEGNSGWGVTIPPPGDVNATLLPKESMEPPSKVFTTHQGGAPEVCRAAEGDVCKAGVKGTAGGQFGSWPNGSLIAIDTEGTQSAADDTVYVGDKERVEAFESDGVYLESIALPGETVMSLAADPSGDLYVAYGDPTTFNEKPKKGVRKLSPAGATLCTAEVASPFAIAAAPSGDFYAFNSGGAHEVLEFDSACNPVDLEPEGPGFGFGGDELALSTGIATGAACLGGGADIYLANIAQLNVEGSYSFVRAWGPPPDDPQCPPARRAPSIDAQYAVSVGTEEATLRAQVNPHFWSGVQGQTDYYAQYATAACIEAEGWQGACVKEQPAPPGSKLKAGTVEEDAAADAFLAGLEPATSYRYRFAAEARDAEGEPTVEGQPVFGVGGKPGEAGAERSFRTFPAAEGPDEECANQALRTGPSAALPDCRAYEMVSPVDKANGEIIVQINNTGNLARLDQSAESGGKIAYSSYRPFGNAVSAPYSSQYIASRGAGGWESENISQPQEGGAVAGLADLEEVYRRFSPDLSVGWLATANEPVLAEGGQAGFVNIYRRDNAGGGFEACTTVQPPGELEHFSPVLQGTSEDEAIAIFRANDHLSEDASNATGGPGAPINQLYACLQDEGGPRTVRLVSVLPDGEASDRASSAGTNNGAGFYGRATSLWHAVSQDGSRVFWASGTDSEDGPAPLYLRENPAQPQSAQLHGSAAGKGDLIGPAGATGKVTKGLKTISELSLSSGVFAVGQEITGAGIPAETTITAVELELGKLKISKSATVSGEDIALTGVASNIVSNVTTSAGAFAVGQKITGAGIPTGTTIASCSPSCGVGATSLALSAKATVTDAAIPLEAFSQCTEAAKACTTPVSASVSSGPAQFWTAAADGSKAVFSIEERLYEFDVATSTAQQIAQGFEGLLGASEDASRIYFASSKALTPGQANSEGDEAVAGKPNAYLYEAGEGAAAYTFVATLSSADVSNDLLSPIQMVPSLHTARVTPDGRQLAFMSSANPTGYDNTDLNSGEADAEVYRYDAGSGGLACVSCNPSGARPAGAEIEDHNIFLSAGLWAGAQIPGWETSLYAPRALSADGSRLFFDSTDALVLADTNGAQDVYQWEAPGTGSCTEASPVFSEEVGGCISLISSGKSPEGSEFIDADPAGENAFFTTEASLLPQDPGLVDLYDARVEGGLPGPEEPPAGCEGEACQSPPEAPNDPTPASSSFQGAGNVQAEAPPPAPCSKGKVRKHGRCVAKVRHERNKGKQHKHRAKHHRKGTVRP